MSGRRADLVTPRLRLRRFVAADRGPCAAMNADPIVMQHFPGLLSREESDAFIARIDAHHGAHGFGLLAIEVPGVTTFAGFAGLSVPRFTAPFTPCVEVGWRLAREHWRQGYASEAAAAAVAHGFTALGLAEIVSFTVPANQRSRRVMERLGMVYDATADFEHPALPEGHPLRPHVLYRLPRAVWAAARSAAGPPQSG